MYIPGFHAFLWTALLLAVSAPGGPSLPVTEGLILDLDAGAGLVLEDGDRVAGWQNQVASSPARLFAKQDQGRDVAGSGRPTLRRGVEALRGHDAVVFRQQELVNAHEAAFDGLTTGKGYTWFCVMAVYAQREGLKDVNSFFGNLRNGGNYEGLWGNVRDDNTVWVGSRNGLTFGRFDENNPQLLGPQLQVGTYHVVAARMAAGTGTVPIEVFVDAPEAAGTVAFPVNAAADPSRLAVGQERDAVEHPGAESFDGEIARFLIYERPLGDEELRQMFAFLTETYLASADAN